MADGTKIEWTGATWNPITGCAVKSPGCLRCYAMTLAGTRLRDHPSRAGLTRVVNGHHVWTGEVRFNEQWLDQPLRWKRPRDIFVVAHGDLFYEKVRLIWQMRIFVVIARAKQHRFQILTKRPDVTLDFLYRAGIEPMSHVWIGTSVERQQEADERRPHLEAIARLGWNTWVSYEPALGPVDWRGWEFIRWVVSGGESGRDARPSHPDWHRATRDWCAVHRIPFFFKQWGGWAPHKPMAGGDLGGDVRSGHVTIVHPTGQTEVEVFRETGINTIKGSRYMANVGKKAAGALLDGVEHKAMP